MFLVPSLALCLPLIASDSMSCTRFCLRNHLGGFELYLAWHRLHDLVYSYLVFRVPSTRPTILGRVVVVFLGDISSRPLVPVDVRSLVVGTSVALLLALHEGSLGRGRVSCLLILPTV